MKKKMMLTMALLSTAMLGLAQNTYTIKGTLQGQGNEKIFISGPQGKVEVDAINNSFTLSGPASSEIYVGFMDTGVDRKLYLGGGKSGMYQPARPLEVVLVAGMNLKVSGNAEGLDLAEVTGEPLNDSFTQYRKALDKELKEMTALQKQLLEARLMGLKEGMEEVAKRMMANRKSISDARKKYISEHPNSFASLYFLAVSAREFSLSELQTLFAGLAPTYKSTRYGKAIQDKIEADKNMQSSGLAPDFTKLDVNGKSVSLSQFKGKYVLLDFWGSWCAPCRAANPHLKELYATYANKGFEILGIASEKVSSQAQAEELWKKAIVQDGLTWTNVINNEVSMKKDVIQMYSIEGYPTQILIDREGKIVARWLGAAGKALDDKLKEIFK